MPSKDYKSFNYNVVPKSLLNLGDAAKEINFRLNHKYLSIIFPNLKPITRNQKLKGVICCNAIVSLYFMSASKELNCGYVLETDPKTGKLTPYQWQLS